MMRVNAVLALGPTARLTPSAYDTITDITASTNIQTWSMNDGNCVKGSRLLPASDGISSASSSCSTAMRDGNETTWIWSQVSPKQREI